MRKLILILLLLSMVLAGCNSGGSSAQGEKKPDKIRNVFLLYTEKDRSEEADSIGTLSLMLDGKEEEIADNVQDGKFAYLNAEDKVLYIDAEHDLYEYKRGGEKTKLAGDAATFALNDSELVAYQELDSDLYVVSADTEKEKIASGVNQHHLIGNEILYLKDNGSLLKYHLEDKMETDYAENVNSFEILDEKDQEIVYVSTDFALYYQNGEDDAIRLSSDGVDPYSIRKSGKSLYFLEVADAPSYRLISADPANGERVEIAGNVHRYEYIDDYFYFINDDSNLFRKKADDKQAEKVASNVYSMKVVDEELYYLNGDMALFRLDGGEKGEKLASAVAMYDVAPNGDIIHMNEDGALFVNDEKVADDVKNYRHFFGNLAFAGSDDKLYLMEDMGKKEVVAEEISRYSNANYQGGTVFSYELDFAALAGVWSGGNGDELEYMQLDKNGWIQDLTRDEGHQLEHMYSGYRTLEAYSTLNGYEFSFYLGEDGKLTMGIDGEEIVFEKSDEAAAKEYIGQLQEEEDTEAVNDLAVDFMSDISYAVSYGEMDYIEEYLQEGSPLYNELETSIAAAYEQDAVYDMVNYEMISTVKTGEGQYTVKTIEEYNTGYDEEKSETIYEVFEKTYILQKDDDDSFKITGIKEVKSDKDMDSI